MVVASSEWKVCQCIERAAEQGDLVSDGRLVVDAAFRTNDPTVFAAGTGAKFSRRSLTSCLMPLVCSACTSLPVGSVFAFFAHDGLVTAAHECVFTAAHECVVAAAHECPLTAAFECLLTAAEDEVLLLLLGC